MSKRLGDHEVTIVHHNANVCGDNVRRDARTREMSALETGVPMMTPIPSLRNVQTSVKEAFLQVQQKVSEGLFREMPWVQPNV